MDSYWTRLIIRCRIAQRRLPNGRAMDVSEGIGDGRRCDACGQVLRASERVVQATVSSAWWSLRFHPECFEIWNSERVSVPRQKSDEEQAPHQRRSGTADKPSLLPSL